MSEITKATESHTQVRLKGKAMKKPSLLQWAWAHPLEYKQHMEMDWKYTPKMEDIELTNVSNLAEQSTITKTIKIMLRLKYLDKLGIAGPKNNKVEFVYIQVQIEGQDRDGNKVAGAYIDEYKDIMNEVVKTYDPETDEESYKKGRSYDVYTKPWKGPSTYDELAEQYIIDDECQYDVDGRSSYGGFSSSEFRNLDFEELCERGARGYVNFPVDYLFSKEATRDRVKMNPQVNKQ